MVLCSIVPRHSVARGVVWRRVCVARGERESAQSSLQQRGGLDVSASAHYELSEAAPCRQQKDDV
jgi:hypothetical protein